MSKQPQPLFDLLNDAVLRSKIGAGVQRAVLIEAANTCISALLPPTRQKDARAQFIRDGMLMIFCLNGAVAQHMAEHEQTIINSMKAAMPNGEIDRVRTKIVRTFPSSEV